MSYTIEQVRKKLATNRQWVERAIVKLYEFQTADEQQNAYTSDKNNVGFNAFDAKTLTYYATWIKSGNNLSGDFLAKAFTMVPKYAQQILNAIEAKAEEPKKEAETLEVNHDHDYSSVNTDEEANCMLQN